MDIIIELAEDYPIVFLCLLVIGIVVSFLVLAVAFKITEILLRIVMVCLSIAALCVLGVIALVTADHLIAALTYEPPPPAQTQPAQTDAETPNQP